MTDLATHTGVSEPVAEAQSQPPPPSDETSGGEHPLSRCGACDQVDDHPKHQILVGFNNENTGGMMFHAHDHGREGMIFYHFDCPTEWHAKVGPDAFADHQKAVSLAVSGVHGDALRAAIQGATS